MHNPLISLTSIEPAEFKLMGKDHFIRYGFHHTPFGLCLLAMRGDEVCRLVFVDEKNRDIAVEEILSIWKGAKVVEDTLVGEPVVQRVFSSSASEGDRPLRLLLKGTPFQLQVWEALLRIPVGTTVSYSQLARSIEKPKATRAVGNAVGRNPIAYLIPCHRVLRSTGEIGGYRWGIARKKAMLGMEITGGNQES